jgi:hypothetical protein
MYEEDLELEFIAGKIGHELPKEKEWLLKYFKDERSNAFLKYFLTFNTYSRFIERTGYYFNASTLIDLRNKLETLLKEHSRVKSEMDFDTLVVIEKGKYKWRRSGK